MSHRSVEVVVTAMLVLAAVTGVVATASAHAGPGTVASTGDEPRSGVATPGAYRESRAPPGAVRERIETDAVRLLIDVQDDGTATWTVEYRTFLDDQNTTEAFDSLRTDIENNRSEYVDQFASRIRNTVDAAENATGRSMNATNFQVDATVEQVSCPSANGCGVITYTFQWTGFARVEDGGDRLAIGDAIEGFFLGTDTRMTIQWPGEYARTSVAPEPDESGTSAVVWRGSGTDFVGDEPSVVVERRATTTTDTGGGTTGGGTTGGGTTTTTTGGGATTSPGGTTPGGDESRGFPFTFVAFGGVLLVALAAGVAWWRTNGGGTTGETPDDGPTAPGGTATAAAETGPDDAAGADEDETAGEDEPFDIDQELLSNEEQVLKLLEHGGGRMKQQEVVSELDWTEAKTSQVISGMRDEGTIDTFRLGRENVVTLPGEDLTASDEDETPEDDG